MNIEFAIVVVASLCVIVSVVLSCWGCPLWGIDREMYLKAMMLIKGQTKWKIFKTEITQDPNSRIYKLEFRKGDVPLTVECHKGGMTFVKCDNPVLNRAFTATRVYDYLEHAYNMKNRELDTIKNL